jgi:hypothetical protein
MAYKITEIEGIGPKYGETLGKAGINTTDDLLDKCADKKRPQSHGWRHWPHGIAAAEMGEHG